MINWIIIIILVVIAIFAIKLNHLRHRSFIIIVVLLALFLYLTMTYVNSKNNIDLNSSEGIFRSIKIYTGWLANGFQNMKALTGNAVKMDWSSANASFTNPKMDATPKNKPSVKLH